MTDEELVRTAADLVAMLNPHWRDGATPSEFDHIKNLIASAIGEAVASLVAEVKRLVARERELVAGLKPFAEATTVPFPGLWAAMNVATALFLAAKEDTSRE